MKTEAQNKSGNRTEVGAEIRLLVVDDADVVRRSVCSLLETQTDFSVVGEAADGIEAIERAEELHPDVIVLDIGLPRLNGIDAARKIRQVAPASQILFLSQHDSAEMARAALNAGGQGFVVKSEAGNELIVAVRAVRERKVFVSAKLAVVWG